MVCWFGGCNPGVGRGLRTFQVRGQFLELLNEQQESELGMRRELTQAAMGQGALPPILMKSAFAAESWHTEHRPAMDFHGKMTRYEMEGALVTIVEEVEPVETTTTASPRLDAPPRSPSCSSTTGRTLAFFRSTDTVTVDGREVARTQTRSGPCSPPTF